MKDVGGRDSPRGVVNQALIRGFPNGETRQSSWAVTRTWLVSGGTRDLARAGASVGVAGGGVGLLFEIWIVDASIWRLVACRPG